MFRFANPQYFWLLPVIPALILLFWLAARNRRRRLLARRLKVAPQRRMRGKFALLPVFIAAT